MMFRWSNANNTSGTKWFLYLMFIVEIYAFLFIIVKGSLFISCGQICQSYEPYLDRNQMSNVLYTNMEATEG